jgi:hypothetical protein
MCGAAPASAGGVGKTGTAADENKVGGVDGGLDSR